MTTLLLFDAPLRSPEMRHEVGEPVTDTVIFIEHEGKRVVAARPLDEPVLSTREDVVDEFWNVEELGYAELVNDGSFEEQQIWPELVRRAVARTGAERVVVPPTFHVLVADYLRGRGIDVVVDAAEWAARRRRKAPWELEGIERAQRAAELAMLTAARMLREAEPTRDNLLRFEGEILTAELIRDAMVQELVGQGAESDEIHVHSGDAWMRGHEPGSGPIRPHTSCIVDCFPRESRSGAYADMTRTFVPGRAPPKLIELHKHCRAALDIAFDSLRPGSSDAYRKVCEYFESNGMPTKARGGHDGALEGFFHDLGHGVGLEVAERPWIGPRSDELVEGDVVAIEPGLYLPGVGGVRLEDTVVVTDSGAEHFTDPYPYELEP